MRAASLWTLIRRDLVRVRGAMMTSGFGIAAGTAALVFFLALGLGVQSVLLGEVFPIDQIELEPPKGKDPGLLGGALGLGSKPPGISEDQVKKLKSTEMIAAVYPKLRMRFPASGHGELFGRRLGTPEMVADGIEPALVADEVKDGPIPFRDPLQAKGKACKATKECEGNRYCEGPAEGTGFCVDPVPVLVSRYLVEFFDKTIAPAHGLPPMGETNRRADTEPRLQALARPVRARSRLRVRQGRTAPRPHPGRGDQSARHRHRHHPPSRDGEALEPRVQRRRRPPRNIRACW